MAGTEKMGASRIVTANEKRTCLAGREPSEGEPDERDDRRGDLVIGNILSMSVERRGGVGKIES